MYPDDNPNDFLNKQGFTNSSNDEQGTIAMQISSESDSEIEINPYWSNVKYEKKLSEGDIGD